MGEVFVVLVFIVLPLTGLCYYLWYEWQMDRRPIQPTTVLKEKEKPPTRLWYRGEMMPVYDTIIVSGREGQVKCWEPNDYTYLDGDAVPDIEEGERNYSIAMREGGWVNVENGYIESWTDKPSPRCPIAYDKWGEPFRGREQELQDALKEVYYERRIDSYTVLD